MTEFNSLLPVSDLHHNSALERPYQRVCVEAVAAALDAEVALEIAIAQLAAEAHRMARAGQAAPAGAAAA